MNWACFFKLTDLCDFLTSYHMFRTSFGCMNLLLIYLLSVPLVCSLFCNPFFPSLGFFVTFCFMLLFLFIHYNLLRTFRLLFVMSWAWWLLVSIGFSIFSLRLFGQMDGLSSAKSSHLFFLLEISEIFSEK